MPVCDTISSWEEFLTWTKRFEPEEKQPQRRQDPAKMGFPRRARGLRTPQNEPGS